MVASGERRRVRVYSRDALGLPAGHRPRTKGNVVVEIQPNGCHHCITHHLLSGYDGDKCRYPYVASKPLHRAVYAMVHGAIPKGLVVRHTCDNTLCVNPKHLIIGTQLDNIRDRVERGGKPIPRVIRRPNPSPQLQPYQLQVFTLSARGLEATEIISARRVTVKTKRRVATSIPLESLPIPVVVIQGNPAIWRLTVE